MEPRSIWVWVEQRDGRLLDVGLEVLGEARRLATRLQSDVAAVLLGNDLANQAREVLERGADSVFLADDPMLEQYRPDTYSSLIASLSAAHQPQILLLGATSVGRDLAPLIAARLETGLCADCTALDLNEDGKLLQIAPVFGGRELATMICPRQRPQMATVRPGVFAKPIRRPSSGEVVKLDLSTIPLQSRTVVHDIVRRKIPGLPLTQADVVVAGGAGVADAAGWELIRKLAKVLGAAVGGTRPPMDDGYLREDQMIGQSGVTIRPKLYICVGISGDIQHTVGFNEAGTVVAINNDPKAPIFQVSDYGIVGDYREVIPSLIEALQRG